MTIAIQERYASLAVGTLCNGAGKFRSRMLDVAAPAGVFVYENDADHCTTPSAAAHVTGARGGFLRFEAAKRTETNGLEYAADEQVTYVKRGPMVVKTEEAVSDGDPVYVRFAAKAGNTQLGACRNDPDGDVAASIQLTNAITGDNAVIDIAIDGVLFQVATGTSEDAADKAALIAAAIDAHADFTAAQVGDTAELSVARVDGALPVVTMLESGVTETSGGTCARLPGARFSGDWGSGAAIIEFDLP